MFMDYARYYLAFALQLLTAFGMIMGSAWTWLGLSTLFALAFIDSFLPEDHAERRIHNRQLANVPAWLSTITAPLLLLLLAWLTGQGHLHGLSLLGAVISVGWMSVICFVPPSHELYHQRGFLPQFVGTYSQIVYLDCTRNIGHTVGHHIDVGTGRDSDTAERGANLYGFTLRAVIRSTVMSNRIESDALEKRGHGRWSLRHRIWKAAAALAIFLALVVATGGWSALLPVLCSMVVARFWVESFNYFQHYGIVRMEGKPVARRHLWNHLGTLTRAVAFEITNHADHHLDSYIPYYKLKPDLAAIRMPNVFLCFLAALVPPIWHGLIIKKALREWDLRFASVDERALAREQNRRAHWPDWLQEAERSSIGTAAA